MKYTKTESISLKKHFSEKWLQDIIEEDPSIIGLGDLQVYRRERKQSSGGRIDFLMLSSDNTTMYEVEIMLGATDESHIIRTIEYWDLEKRRFPSRDHKAVLIAESITNRFFNVISLMNKSIPIIAIQLNAFKHDDNVFLDFVKVLDIYESPEDEEDLGLETVDRSYWEQKANIESINMMDFIKSLLIEKYEELRITYNKHHVAFGTLSKNIMWLRPRKKKGYCHIEILVGTGNIEEVKTKLEEAIDSFSVVKEKKVVFSITREKFDENLEILKDVMMIALNQYK